jgi:plastocyanin
MECLMPMLSPWKPATLCFLGAITACGSTGPDDDFDGVTINMTAGLLFAPADVTIDPGTRVRWVSAAAILHTITPNTPGQPGVWAAVNTSQAGTDLHVCLPDTCCRGHDRRHSRPVGLRRYPFTGEGS